MVSVDFLLYGIKRISRKPPLEMAHFGLHYAKLIPIHILNKFLLNKQGTLELDDKDFTKKLINVEFTHQDNPYQCVYDHFLFKNKEFFFNPNDELKGKYISHFPDQCKETLELAERALNHDFELLGHNIKFDKTINYHYAFDQESSTYFANINYLATNKDVKVTWELNRHQFLVTLAKAYFISGNEKYAQEVCTQISEWIEQNPYLVGVNWIEGIEASIRMYSWIFSYQLIKNSQCFTPELNFKILKWIYMHGKFIRRFLSDKWIINGNHLLAELSGLILIGLTFSEFKESNEWVDFAIKKLEIELDKQVFDDGAIWEHSTGYQKFVTEMILYPVILLTKNEDKVPELILQKLSKMIDFLFTVSMSNGKIPLIGDDDQGFMLKITSAKYDYTRDITSCGSFLLKKENVPTFNSELSFWLFDGLILGESKIMYPVPRLKIFEDSGYCAFKSSKDFLLFVTTAQNKKYLHAAHRHLDMLSFVYEHEGEYFIVDNGTYVYNGDEYNRNLFRSTWMHNTVTINNKNPCQLGPFELQPKPYAKIIKSGNINEDFIVWACHDGYKSGYNRIVLGSNDGYLIYDFTKDEVECFESYIHLHPQVSVDKIDDCNLMLVKNGVKLYISSLESISLIDSKYSPEYGFAFNSKALIVNSKIGKNRSAIKISQIYSEIKEMELKKVTQAVNSFI